MKNVVRTAAFLVLLIGLAVAFDSGRSAAEPARHYVCPPCGLPCDDAVYDAPGPCPKCGMALVDQQAAASAPRPARKKVGILVFTGVEIIDFSGPYEVFGAAGFDVYTVGETKDPVTSAMGLTVVPKYSFADFPQPDVLVVPGGGIQAARKSEATLKWIRDVTARAEQTMSVCNGAFLLASAGLLDGLKATTTARRIDQLSKEYPKTQVVNDRRYVDNGKIITTGGLSSGIDGALHVIAKMKGNGTAQQAALDEEYDWRPDSGFARATLADMLIPDVDLGQIGDWTVVSTQGGTDRWEVVVRGTSDRNAGELSEFLGKGFIEKGKWTPRANAAAASRASALKTDWSLAGRDGKPWNATLTVEPVAGEARTYQARLTLARAVA